MCIRQAAYSSNNGETCGTAYVFLFIYTSKGTPDHLVHLPSLKCVRDGQSNHTSLTLTKLVCWRNVWKGFSIAELLLKGGWPCPPSAEGMRQTITVLSMLQDTSMESSGDLVYRSIRKNTKEVVPLFR